MKKVYEINGERKGRRVFYGDGDFTEGDTVVVDTCNGPEIGTITAELDELPEKASEEAMKWILCKVPETKKQKFEKKQQEIDELRDMILNLIDEREDDLKLKLYAIVDKDIARLVSKKEELEKDLEQMNSPACCSALAAAIIF